MFSHYIASAYRVLLKDKLFSFINIASLTVGLAASILILLFVFDELSYDDWITDGGRIARVEITYSPIGRDPMSFAMSPGPVLSSMLEDFPEVEAGVRMFFDGGYNFILNGATTDEAIVFADSDMFTVFEDFLIAGNPETALADNNSVVISETIKQKYFGDGLALGETMQRLNGDTMRVTGIMKNLPYNTHLDINMMFRFDEARFDSAPQIAKEWRGANLFTYLKFVPGTNFDAIRDRLPDMVERRAVLTGYLAEMDDRRTEAINLHLVPLQDIYLGSERMGQISDWTGNSRGPADGGLVNSLAVIAALILGIAIINYVNLSTAMASKRAREISLRKIVGASRRQIIIQFLTESVLITFIALLGACALIELALPAYNQLIEKQLSLSFENYFDVGLWLIATGIVVGLVAGLYPALYLSGFKPARTLSNSASGNIATNRLRNFLVVTQFSISIGLIICTSILFAQTKFATSKDLGFTKENMVVVRNIGNNHYAAFGDTLKTELMQISGVKSVGRSAAVPSDLFEDNTRVSFSDQPGLDPIPISELSVDPDFFNSYEIEALAGRLLEWQRGSDLVNLPEDGAPNSISAASVVLNIAAVDLLGLTSPEAALGRTFQAAVGQQPVDFTVIGVIPDFNFKSIHEKAGAYLLYHEPNRLRSMTIRLDGEDIGASLAAIDDTWNKLVPDEPINRSMLEDNINNSYGDEKRGGTVVMAFTLLGTLVAAAGLYGLASFSAEKRTKEIGIRKVFGARVRDVALLLMWQFTRPALLANLIAWPIAWYIMRDWLDGFAYRIDLGSSYFFYAGATALIVAWLTVTIHVMRVARANPIHALRHD